MFTDHSKFNFGMVFIIIFLLVIGFFLYLGWRQGEKIKKHEAESITKDLEVIAGQLAR